MSLSIIIITSCKTRSDYNIELLAYADSLNKYASTCINCAEKRRDTWHTAIFDKEYYNPITGDLESSDISDFNIALGWFDYDMDPIYNIIYRQQRNAKILFLLIKDTRVMNDAEVAKKVKELYLLYNNLYKISISADGYTLKSYGEELTSRRIDFEKFYDEFILL
jgi:hypothetical protein